jgi:hypothetical protein
MPRYVVTSEGPISVRQVERPDLPDMPSWPTDPDYGIEVPVRPGHGLPPSLPPRDEWPPLPPWFQPGVGLPIPPTVEHPMVPVDPEGTDPPEIWPPPRQPIELPDMSGKSLALARIFVSRHVNFLAWVLIDHEEAKAKAQKALDAIKGKLPAGGVGGRPPQTRPPGT